MQTDSQLVKIPSQYIASTVRNVGLLLLFSLFQTALGVNVFADPSSATVVTLEDTAVTTGNVLAPFTVLQGGDWHLASFTQALNGLVVDNRDSTFTYTPAADFHGVDSFIYTVSVDDGRSVTGTVDITVTPVNDPPPATSMYIITDEDTVSSGVMPHVVDVDIDTNGDKHTFVIVSPPEHGVATVVLNDQVGIVTLAWDPVDDSSLAGYTLYYGLVGAGTTAIDVGSQTSYRLTDLTAGSRYAFEVTTYDTFGNESSFSRSVIYRVPYASELMYIPHLNFSGTDSFTYMAIDTAGASVVGIASITVHPVNDVPIVVNQEISTQEDISVTTKNVLANAVDADGDSLQIVSFTPSAYGTVVENGDGTFTYSPPPNFHGMDRFTYVVNDGNGGNATGTVVVTVISVNDAPVANAVSLSTSENKAITLPAQWPASDVDDVLTLIDYTQPAHGRIVVRSNGSLRYIPDADFKGFDSFTYTVSDAMGDTATGVVTLRVGGQSALPRASNDLSRTVEEMPTVINVLANDVAIEGNPGYIIAFTQPADGTVIYNGDGTFTYTPEADFYGTDSFTYTVADNSDLLTTAAALVTVTPVNDPPVAEPQHVITAAEMPVALTLVGHDIDDDPLTCVIVTPPAYGTLSGIPPLVTYTPESGFHGTDSLTFRVDDGKESSPPVVVTILVTATALANGGFETGDFTAWTTFGEARIETVAYGSGPTEGIFQALLLTTGPIEEVGDTTGGAVPVAALETFFGFQPGSLDSISTSPVVEGSAIKRTFTAQAGTVLSFDWNFLTDEATNLDEPAAFSNPDANDLVFVTITPLSLVADTFWTFVLSAADFAGETGFATFTVTLPTTGSYTLGIGVVDVGDAIGLSGLLLDNITLTPPANP